MACQSYRTGIILRNIFLTFFTLCAISLASRQAGAVGEDLPEGETVTIFWTAPGDDGRVGQAAVYDIRYSSEEVGPDTLAWWEAADTCIGEPVPAPSGQRQSFMATGLDPEKVYYFAIRTADERLNWSEISNIYSTAYFLTADINDDGNINILDVMYLINFFYRGGPPPPHMSWADINHDGMINILDGSYLIDYLYRGGPEPT